jgi:Replication-relaxation
MPNDDKLWAAFSSYVYLTAKQCIQVIGCKPDYIQVRLRRLYEAGYLDRQQKNNFSEYVYFFTEKGGDLAAERGHLLAPRWITKKSPMTLDHDVTISDFHMRLSAQLLPPNGMEWHQWRGDLAKSFGEWIPDAHFAISVAGWHVLEIVKSGESGYKKGESSLVAKLKTYDAEKHKTLVVMPTTQRIVNFLSKIEDELPSTRLWFTDEASYQRDILGKIWWTPKNFRDRQYSITKPEA